MSLPDPPGGGRWPSDAKLGLLTDLYQLTMLQAYLEQGLHDTAVFDLFVRRLPRTRSYLVACGIDDALRCLEALSFDGEALERLETLGVLSKRLLDHLAGFRFTGDVDAVPEGTVVFAGEPILDVVAPIGEAQLAETLLINRVHLGTVAASKAARVVGAAAGRPVVDFALRRMHGADASLHGARAFFVAGVSATSNVLAGLEWGIPVAGTMAHSFVEVPGDELDAFRAFARSFPETTLLVDTYDSLDGVRNVVRLARELGAAFGVAAVRLDSGDLGELARGARGILDDAGLTAVRILASSSLDEWAIAELVAAGAPIDAFGVGSRMGVSEDAPSLDMVYKLAAYGGAGRMKLSPGKETWPGRKQVLRGERGGEMAGDVVARAGEPLPGRPLLEPAMRGGRRVAPAPPLAEARKRAAREIAALPARLRELDLAGPPYPVTASPALEAERLRVRAALAGR